MDHSDVRKQVLAWLERRPDVEPVQFGAHTTLAVSTCRHFLDGSLASGHERVAREFARVLRLAEAGDILPVGVNGAVTITEARTDAVVRRVKRSRDIYLTETLRRVGQVLTYCAEYAQIGVITADYGVGKTEAVRHWRANSGRKIESLVFEFDEYSARNVSDFIECLADRLDASYSRGPHNGGRTFRAVCERLQEAPCLLILDQCETVSPRVMQVVRQIWDRTRDAGVGIALLAAPVLMIRMQASRLRDLEALKSRVGVWAQLTGLSKEEMAAVCKQEGLTDIDEAAFDLWWRAIGGSMRRLMAGVELLQSKHANKRITERTIVGVAAQLWGLSLDNGRIARAS